MPLSAAYEITAPTPDTNTEPQQVDIFILQNHLAVGDYEDYHRLPIDYP